MSQKLKHITTSDHIEIKQKYKTPYTVPNHISVIVISNFSAIRLDNDDRRWVILDISSKYVGNRAYFDRLLRASRHSDIGRALWGFLQSIKRGFNEFNIPLTQAKSDNINENLHGFFQFLKEHYLMLGNGIDMRLVDLHTHYARTCKDALTKVMMGKKLREIGIQPSKKTVNGVTSVFVNVIYERLKLIYENKGWIHELDEPPAFPTGTVPEDMSDLRGILESKGILLKSTTKVDGRTWLWVAAPYEKLAELCYEDELVDFEEA